MNRTPRLQRRLNQRLILIAGCALAAASHLVAQDCLPLGLEVGLVRHYRLDGNGIDSVSGTSGTVFGAVAAFDRFGTPAAAMDFDGVNDFIEASAGGLPVGARTVALWFYADSVTNRPAMLGYGGSGCSTAWFMGLNVGFGGENAYYVHTHCSMPPLTSSYGAIPPINAWHHLAISTAPVPVGTTIYLDGNMVASNSMLFIQGTIVAGCDLAIGAITGLNGQAPYADPNVGYWNGRLDDMLIFNRAISAAEVQSLFSSVPQSNYPGYGEELYLLTSVGASPLTGCPDHRSATAGQLLGFSVTSPTGAFVGAPWLIAAEIVATGAPLSESFPGVWINPNSFFLVYNGLAAPFGPSALLPGGNTIGAVAPQTLIGFSVILQSAVFAQNTANGVMTVSDAKVIDIQ